jgi:hypothetical protein
LKSVSIAEDVKDEFDVPKSTVALTDSFVPVIVIVAPVVVPEDVTSPLFGDVKSETLNLYI